MSRKYGVVSRWWDVAIIGTCVMTVAIVLVAGAGSSASWAASGGVAAIVAVYVAVGRRALARPRGTALSRWAAALFILTGALGTWFDPSAQFVQPVLYPLMWLLSTGARSAIIRSAALAAAMGLAMGFGTGYWVSAAIGAGLSFVFAVALGVWMTRIQQYGAERDQLLTELRAAQDEVAALEREGGIIEERARVAREIHDTIAQSLTGLVMTAQRATSMAERAPESVGPQLALIEDLAQEALAEARTLVATYTPVTVSGGLPATLAGLADRFHAETGVTVTVSGDAPNVARETELVLLRCAQEALANVRKHARAQSVQVRLEGTPSGAGLTVTDDGVGIGAQAGSGYGLAGMAERVRLVGGTVQVGPGVVTGTTVRVVVPRRDAEEAIA